MCSITILPRGVIVTPEILQGLRNAAYVDSDGAGFGISTDGYVIRDRSMNAEALIEEFAVARETWHQGVAVIHFRLATAKKPAPEHLHPFGTDRGRFLFFNGALPDLEEPERSDARVLAEDIMPGRLPEALDGIIGPYNKAVMLWPAPEGHRQHYVANPSQWLTGPDGTLWSNADYLGKGTGWDEMTIEGELYRFNVMQPGDCCRCSLRGHDEDDCDLPRAKVPYRWRSETKRIAGLT